MQITRKDIGYTVYSRVEESLRSLLSERLLNLLGPVWPDQVPAGLWSKARERAPVEPASAIDDPMLLLEELDIPDLMEIICHKKSYAAFFPSVAVPTDDFRDMMESLYRLRCKIAHVKRAFSSLDLDALMDLSERLLPMLAPYDKELTEVLRCIRTSPEAVVVHIPASFLISSDETKFKLLTNLPSADYDSDGGFIGRKEDQDRLEKLLLGDVHRVLTIAGAGGVGKTALAHQVCQNLLRLEKAPFDGLVWVSAKEEKLTATGIEPLAPSLRSYEDVLDSILLTFGWDQELEKSIDDRQYAVDLILRAGDKGILLVVDNLETIRDDRVFEFIKDFPPPSKVLITSRLGLGEVERRIPLKEMKTKDAITLLRTVAREKGADGLAKLSDDVLSSYVQKMSRYPLAIKWVVGQVALGKDINLALSNLTESTGDVAKFCFEVIFDRMLNDNHKMLLFALAVNDKPVLPGVLSHIANLSGENLETAIREMTVASLVIPTQTSLQDNSIETRYELLPLTRNYIYSKLRHDQVIHRELKSRIEMVQNLLEEAERAGQHYRYSLRDMGAESDEEKIAATWANTGYQKYQGGDYEGSVAAFQRAAQIAPRFPAIYRNWAAIESDAGFHDKAEELMKKAVDLSPADSRLWFFWGNIEKRRQRYDRASAHLNHALLLAPNDAPILGSLGEVEKRRGNFAQADDLLRRSLAGDYLGVSRRRHEIVCYTALAECGRRWAETLLRESHEEQGIEKLSGALEMALKASELGPDDPRAVNTFRETSLDFGRLVKRRLGFERARWHFESAIAEHPQSAREKKTNVFACHCLAMALIEEGMVEEAKKYYDLGRKSLLPGVPMSDKYRDLGLLFSRDRATGVLVRVVAGKGFGYLDCIPSTGRLVFLHSKEMVPRVSLDDFESFRGRRLTFTVAHDSRGPHARKAVLLGENTPKP